MNDPHVETLCYRLVTSSGLQFKENIQLDGQTPNFKYEVDNCRLVVKLTGHFPTAELAQMVVDPFLKSWEIAESLQRGRKELWFEFDGAEVIDRDPPPPGSVIAHVESITASASFSARATVVHIQSEYPTPPTTFSQVSNEGQMLWKRYEQYVEGREPLLAMAYFCLDHIVRGVAGSGKGQYSRADPLLNIEATVLIQIGELVSTRGTIEDARKADFIGALTAEEEEWLRKAIRALIRRKIEIDANPTAPRQRITMNDI